MRILLGRYALVSTPTLAEALSLCGGLSPGEPTRTAPGFTSIYRPKTGGVRFADLLDRVSAAHPRVRFRFVSPHPKDFPEEVSTPGGGLAVIFFRYSVTCKFFFPSL